MSATVESGSQDARNQTIMKAVTKFASIVADGEMLVINDVGLMRRTESGFQRLPYGAPVPEGPVYISVKLPALCDVVDGLGDALAQVVERSFHLHERGIRMLADKKEGLSHFDLTRDGTRLYVNVQPIIEQPEAALKHLDIISRRGAMLGISTAIAGGLGFDAYRRFSSDESSGTNRLLGVIEAAGAAYFGKGLIGEGLKAAIRRLPSYNQLACDPREAEESWQQFVKNVRTQIGPQERQ